MVSIDTLEFRENVRKMISRKVFNNQDQEDITQEVLLKVVRYAHIEEPASFFSWLKMAVNSSIGDFYRKRGRPEEEFKEVDTTSVSDNQDLTCCIDPFLKKMPSSEAHIIREIDLNGKSQLQMASELGIKYSTLKSRLQKSRKTLLDSISACCHPESDSCLAKEINCKSS